MLTQARVIAVFILISIAVPAAARTVTYDLDIDYKSVTINGKRSQGMAVNGTIPGPVLRFTEGDRAMIRVRNQMKEETSVHWHGILLPNQYDGVPYVTTMPINPGGEHIFTFDLNHSGTYWYHSHTNLQEQSGIYGAIVIEPRDKRIRVDHDIVLMFSDWTSEKPGEVLRTLKRGDEWYAIKKGTAQSWDRVIRNHAVAGRLRQSFGRMSPMDVSDIAYDQFLVNGAQKIKPDDLKPGERVRLRLINGAASSYFKINYAGGPLTVIAADGMDVVPIKADIIPMAVAETYDILLTVPDSAMELRATAADGSGYASVIIGPGKVKEAPKVPPPDPFAMLKGGHAMAGMDHSTSKERPMKMAGMGQVGRQLSYQMLRSVGRSTLPVGRAWREVVLNLTGNMDRYQWSINDIPLSEADKILIRKGENVRFRLVNKTMMAHPMHLHGHFFRVINGQGDHAPLKHTVNVAPMAETVIEFAADEDKDWFFHCHILYHMMSGMARVVHDQGSVIDPALAAAKGKSRFEIDDDHWFSWGELVAESHMNEGHLISANNRNEIGVEWDSDWHDAWEISPWYGRRMGRFLTLFIGGDFDEEEELGVAGIRYVLPLYIETELRIDDNGDFRASAGSELELLPRLSLSWSVNIDDQWRYGVEWRISKRLSVTASHDSDYDAGAGLKMRF